MAVMQQKMPSIDDLSTNDDSIRLMEIELAQPLPIIKAFDEKTGHSYRRVHCLIRLHTQPLGMVALSLIESELHPEQYAQPIWLSLSKKITEHLRIDGVQPITELTAHGLPGFNTPRCIEERERFLADAPFVSVIISTRDRPEQLAITLHSLLSLRYPRYEIIVVNNAPSSSATEEYMLKTFSHDPVVRYVREDRRGLAWGRNCGMMTAKGEILVFTDDDVVVDQYWLAELVRGFDQAEDVVCVTGLILSLELETPAQLLYEQRGGSSRGFTRRVFDQVARHVHLYKSGQFGSGANMAFKRSFLRSLNGFDQALGAGTPAQAAEETAAFFQVILHGHKIVYEPSALLYHPPYRNYAALRKQIYGYGVGFTAYLLKSVLDHPYLLFDLFIKVPRDLFFQGIGLSQRNSKRAKQYPKELAWLERKGMLYGPLAYIQSRGMTRKMRQKAFLRNDQA